MTTMVQSPPMTREQNERIVADVNRERPRLRQFIRRFMDERDTDDILQDVFSELIEAYRLMKPIEQVGAWLYRVARNRITDRFRKAGREVSWSEGEEGDDEELTLERLLPDADAGPESAFARQLLLDEIFVALDELPAIQRDVFIAHEIEGASFRQISEQTGVTVNTLLARKHAAVLHLRNRLRDIFEEYANRGVP
ncbi:MAG: RNA polymerase sigma factor [Povalibacter sp.]